MLTKRADRMLGSRRSAAATSSARTLATCRSTSTQPRGRCRTSTLGVSVENQAAADERVQCLLETPAAVRFLSVEPLLGPVSLDHVAWLWRCENCGEAKPPVSDPSSVRWRWRGDLWQHLCASSHPQAGAWDARRFSGIDWVIVGGESGPGARPCHLSWIRSVVEQCKAAGVPCFVKQLGAQPVPRTWSDAAREVTIESRKGGDMAEWPYDLRVREFPKENR
jgi:protein gp37